HFRACFLRPFARIDPGEQGVELVCRGVEINLGSHPPDQRGDAFGVLPGEEFRSLLGAPTLLSDRRSEERARRRARRVAEKLRLLAVTQRIKALIEVALQ